MRFLHWLLAVLSVAVISSTASCRVIDRMVLADRPPAACRTESCLLATHNRIGKYWKSHGRVPSRSEELPDEPWRDCSMIDGWGRKLNWDSDEKGVVRVWSLGRDGLPGGKGEDAELEVVFTAGDSAPGYIRTIEF